MPQTSLTIPQSPSLECVRQSYRAYHAAAARNATRTPLCVATWRPLFDYIAEDDCAQAPLEAARDLIVSALHAPAPTTAAAHMVHRGIAAALGRYEPTFRPFNEAVFADCELSLMGSTLEAFVPPVPAAPPGPRQAAVTSFYAAVYVRLGALWGTLEQAVPRAIATFSVLSEAHRQTKVALDRHVGLTRLREALYLNRCRSEGALHHRVESMAQHLTQEVLCAIDRFVQLEGGWRLWAEHEGLLAASSPAPSDARLAVVRLRLACYLLHVMSTLESYEPEDVLALMLGEDVAMLVATLPQQSAAFQALLHDVETFAVAAGVEATLRQSVAQETQTA